MFLLERTRIVVAVGAEQKPKEKKGRQKEKEKKKQIEREDEQSGSLLHRATGSFSAEALLGFSTDRSGQKLCLVYELMPNRSLQEALLDQKCPELMVWKKRSHGTEEKSGGGEGKGEGGRIFFWFAEEERKEEREGRKKRERKDQRKKERTDRREERKEEREDGKRQNRGNRQNGLQRKKKKTC